MEPIRYYTTYTTHAVGDLSTLAYITLSRHIIKNIASFSLYFKELERNLQFRTYYYAVTKNEWEAFDQKIAELLKSNDKYISESLYSHLITLEHIAAKSITHFSPRLTTACETILNYSVGVPLHTKPDVVAQSVFQNSTKSSNFPHAISSQKNWTLPLSNESQNMEIETLQLLTRLSLGDSGIENVSEKYTQDSSSQIVDNVNTPQTNDVDHTTQEKYSTDEYINPQYLEQHIQLTEDQISSGPIAPQAEQLSKMQLPVESSNVLISSSDQSESSSQDFKRYIPKLRHENSDTYNLYTYQRTSSHQHRRPFHKYYNNRNSRQYRQKNTSSSERVVSESFQKSISTSTSNNNFLENYMYRRRSFHHFAKNRTHN